MNTVTLKASEIAELADAAKKHGTVELAKLIGVGKTQLYRILKGHTRVTEATAGKINAWLNTGIPQPEKRPSETIWDDPKFLRIAVVKVAKAILLGRLKNVSLTINGDLYKCGD